MAWQKGSGLRRKFLATHSCGVRPAAIGYIADVDRFLSTHSCGVRLLKKMQFTGHTKFLSTHSCGVRPAKQAVKLLRHAISIHALLWSATPFAAMLMVAIFISIHALLWSATTTRIFAFNTCAISIHALLWSATFPVCLLSSAIRYFYPRTPVECDEISVERHFDHS